MIDANDTGSEDRSIGIEIIIGSGKCSYKYKNDAMYNLIDILSMPLINTSCTKLISMLQAFKSDTPILLPCGC